MAAPIRSLSEIKSLIKTFNGPQLVVAIDEAITDEKYSAIRKFLDSRGTRVPAVKVNDQESFDLRNAVQISKDLAKQLDELHRTLHQWMKNSETLLEAERDVNWRRDLLRREKNEADEEIRRLRTVIAGRRGHCPISSTFISGKFSRVSLKVPTEEIPINISSILKVPVDQECRITVNDTYVCFSTKDGVIWIFDLKTGRLDLLRGHDKMITDMALSLHVKTHLITCDNNLVFSRWEVESKTLEMNIHFMSQNEQDEEDADYMPILCWHALDKDYFFIGIMTSVLRINSSNIEKKGLSLTYPLMETIVGLDLLGDHDGMVISMCMSQTCKLVTADDHGMIKIWDECTLIYSFMADGATSAVSKIEDAGHIVLLTTGNNFKVWEMKEDRWILSQIVELQSGGEETFLNFLGIIPQKHFALLIAASKGRTSIIILHLNVGSGSARADRIFEVSVKAPILRLVTTGYDKGHLEMLCLLHSGLEKIAFSLPL